MTCGVFDSFVNALCLCFVSELLFRSTKSLSPLNLMDGNPSVSVVDVDCL
jgi:hypothetical protein